MKKLAVFVALAMMIIFTACGADKAEVYATLEAKNCFYDAGFVEYIAGAEEAAELAFTAVDSADVEWSVYLLDEAFEDFYASCGSRTMVFGDRFPLLYFAEAYQLDYYAAFPGCGTQTEPSAATIAFLTEKVRKQQIPTVWYIEFSNHLVADSIAEATGAKTALFHSCHNVTRQQLEDGITYLTLMRGNLETLKETMK